MATFKVRLEGALDWDVIEQPERSGWVGICDSLAITVEGRTWQEFTEAANEAVLYTVRTHLIEGTLGDFVRQHGWIASALPPADMDPEEVELDVPFDLRRGGASGREANPH